VPLAPDLSAGAQAIARLSPGGPLVLALSGGGDSMALACLMAREAARSGREFHALVVDHRLRSESGEEAALAARRAEALGAIAHRLVWENPAPGQAAARLARHRLLADATRALGADTVFLGHTADDVIETMLMRLSRAGANWRGLAAMGETAISPVWPEGRGVRLARPLVRVSRAQLRLYLQAENVDWIDDPSNTNAAFERVRVRARAPLPDSQTGRRLLALNSAALETDRAVRRAARALVEAGSEILPWGAAVLQPALFARVADDVAARALEALILAVSGEPAAPAPQTVSRMLDAVRAGQAFTAAGVMLTARGVLGRDPGAATGRADGSAGASSLRVEPGECAIFDGRMMVCAGTLPLRVEALAQRNTVVDGVPAPLRPSLAAITGADGLAIAGRDSVSGGGAAGALIAERLAGLLGVSMDGTGS